MIHCIFMLAESISAFTIIALTIITNTTMIIIVVAATTISTIITAIAIIAVAIITRFMTVVGTKELLVDYAALLEC